MAIQPEAVNGKPRKIVVPPLLKAPTPGGPLTPSMPALDAANYIPKPFTYAPEHPVEGPLGPHAMVRGAAPAVPLPPPGGPLAPTVQTAAIAPTGANRNLQRMTGAGPSPAGPLAQVNAPAPTPTSAFPAQAARPDLTAKPINIRANVAPKAKVPFAPTGKPTPPVNPLPVDLGIGTLPAQDPNLGLRPGQPIPLAEGLPTKFPALQSRTSGIRAPAPLSVPSVGAGAGSALTAGARRPAIPDSGFTPAAVAEVPPPGTAALKAGTSPLTARSPGWPTSSPWSPLVGPPVPTSSPWSPTVGPPLPSSPWSPMVGPPVPTSSPLPPLVGPPRPPPGTASPSIGPGKPLVGPPGPGGGPGTQAAGYRGANIVGGQPTSPTPAAPRFSTVRPGAGTTATATPTTATGYARQAAGAVAAPLRGLGGKANALGGAVIRSPVTAARAIPGAIRAGGAVAGRANTSGIAQGAALAAMANPEGAAHLAGQVSAGDVGGIAGGAVGGLKASGDYLVNGLGKDIQLAQGTPEDPRLGGIIGTNRDGTPIHRPADDYSGSVQADSAADRILSSNPVTGLPYGAIKNLGNSVNTVMGLSPSEIAANFQTGAGKLKDAFMGGRGAAPTSPATPAADPNPNHLPDAALAQVRQAGGDPASYTVTGDGQLLALPGTKPPEPTAPAPAAAPGGGTAAELNAQYDRQGIGPGAAASQAPAQAPSPKVTGQAPAPAAPRDAYRDVLVRQFQAAAAHQANHGQGQWVFPPGTGTEPVWQANDAHERMTHVAAAIAAHDQAAAHGVHAAGLAQLATAQARSPVEKAEEVANSPAATALHLAENRVAPGDMPAVAAQVRAAARGGAQAGQGIHVGNVTSAIQGDPNLGHFGKMFDPTSAGYDAKADLGQVLDHIQNLPGVGTNPYLNSVVKAGIQNRFPGQSYEDAYRGLGPMAEPGGLGSVLPFYGPAQAARHQRAKAQRALLLSAGLPAFR